jgi:hypothetical protein
MSTNVIYTPIDPLIPIPEIDTEKFYHWLMDNYPKTRAYREMLAMRNDTAMHTIKDYPWNLIICYLGNMGWTSTLKEDWPELADWIPRAWGIDITDISVIAFLHTKDEHLGTAFWHNDVDEMGLRFYMEFEDIENNKLLMRRTKIKYNTRPTFEYPMDEGKYLQQDTLTCKLLKNNQTFFLNNKLAAHAIHTDVPGKLRIACLIGTNSSSHGKISESIDSIIERSAEKYKDYSLYWRPEE